MDPEELSAPRRKRTAAAKAMIAQATANSDDEESWDIRKPSANQQQPYPTPNMAPQVVLPTVPIPMSKMNGSIQQPPPDIKPIQVSSSADEIVIVEERIAPQEEEEKRQNLIQQVTAQSALEQKRIRKEKKKKKKKKRERQERERALAAAAARRQADEDDDDEEEEEEEDDDLEIIEDENGCTVRIRPKAIKLKIKTSNVSKSGGPLSSYPPMGTSHQQLLPPTMSGSHAPPQVQPPTSNGHNGNGNGNGNSKDNPYEFLDEDETAVNGSEDKSEAVSSGPAAKRRKRSSLNKDTRTHCDKCDTDGANDNLVRCDECKKCYHFWCLNPAVKKSPKVAGYSWHCNECDPSDVDSDWHLD